MSEVDEAVEIVEDEAVEVEPVGVGNRAERDMDEVSDEELDALADATVATLKELLGFFEIGDYSIEEYEGDEGELILDIVGSDLNRLIGRHGRTAEALQVVAAAIASRRCGVHYPVTIDVEGYKHRRKQKVIAIAKDTADRVISSGRSVPLKPMTPAERRQVHMALAEVQAVTTTSEGRGEYRHVVVLPVE